MKAAFLAILIWCAQGTLAATNATNATNTTTPAPTPAFTCDDGVCVAYANKEPHFGTQETCEAHCPAPSYASRNWAIALLAIFLFLLGFHYCVLREEAAVLNPTINSYGWWLRDMHPDRALSTPSTAASCNA